MFNYDKTEQYRTYPGYEVSDARVWEWREFTVNMANARTRNVQHLTTTLPDLGTKKITVTVAADQNISPPPCRICGQRKLLYELLQIKHPSATKKYKEIQFKLKFYRSKASTPQWHRYSI